MCNQPSVELFVNDVSQGKKQRDVSKFPACGYVWDVTLDEGDVELRAESKDLVHIVDCQASLIGTIATDFIVFTEHNNAQTEVIVQLIDENGYAVQFDERSVRFTSR